MWTLLLVGSADAADLAVGPAQPFATIADAVAAAASGDRVLVEPGTYPEGELRVEAGLVVEIRAAAGPGTVQLLATDASLLDVRDFAELTLAEVEFDGQGATRLATVIDGGRLLVDGCDVHDTDAGGGESGGAVLVFDGVLIVNASTFTTSRGDQDGGFLSLTDSTATLSASTFTGGSTDGDGGAVDVDGGSGLAIAGCAFAGNTAGDDGGAVQVVASDVTVTTSAFTGNVAGGDGTLRCLNAGICGAADTLFDGNVAALGSAAAFQDTAGAGLLRATVCRSTGSAAVVFENTAGALENSVLLSNDLDQGVVVVDAAATVALTNNAFLGNLSDGVGTAVRVEGTATLVNNLVAWNSGPAAAISTGFGGTSSGGYQAYWQNLAADTDTALTGDLVGVDLLVPAPAAGSCDLTGLVPPASSPLVDAGDPAILDADGSPSDIGPWGGLEALPFPPDADGDGWYEGTDCDEAAAAIHPGQPDVPCNGLDDDCDPLTTDDVDFDLDGVSVCLGDCDDGDPDATVLTQRYTDADGDTFGTGELFTVCGEPFGTSAGDGDCDDADPFSFPGGEDLPYDGIDQDCDGLDRDDLDEDGVLGALDCDDLDPARSPELADTPDDGVDQDCTGSDATARLKGPTGLRCGCATGAGGAAPFGLLALLAIRRRTRSR